MLDLKEAPSHLIVIGGSYIGLELGQVWARFGSHVTILEQGNTVVPREDHDVSDAVAQMLRDEGLDVRTGVAIERIQADGDSVVVEFASGERLAGDRVLVAAGRIPQSGDSAWTRSA